MIDDTRFAEIADAAPFPMWRSDAEGRCTVLNAGWTAVTGQDAASGLGRGWMAHIHPSDIDTLKAQFSQASARRTAYQAEYRIRCADGNYRWVVDSATPRLDERGDLLGYVGSLVDIGDRKLAELELARAERRLRVATQAAGIGIWEWDLTTNTFVCSPRAIEIFGFEDNSEITFEQFRAVMHPEDLAMVQAASERALDPAIRSSEPYQYRIVRPDTHEVRWILAHAEATFEPTTGQAVSYIGTFQDVTDSHLAEEALRDSEARLRMALEAAGLVVWELDLDSNQVTPSSDLNRFFGLPLDMRPTLEQLHDCYAPGERERLARLGEEARARGETSLSTEFRFITPGGGERWGLLLAQAAPPTGASGPRAIGILMDITERKHNEERLQTVADELQHRVKNSLTIVQSLALQTFRDLPGGQGHLDRFVGRLHALAAATNALTSGEPGAADLSALVDEVTGPYRDGLNDPFRKSGHKIMLDAKAAAAFSMALHELSTNAVKYGALSQPGGWIELCWRDDGRGVFLEWIEKEGPAVLAPATKGFGTRLLSGLFRDGNFALEYRPDGVVCRLYWPTSSRSHT